MSSLRNLSSNQGQGYLRINECVNYRGNPIMISLDTWRYRYLVINLETRYICLREIVACSAGIRKSLKKHQP